MAEHLSEFDAEKAGEALGAEPHETRDVAYGDGHAITAGDTTLEVYKNARVARVTTPDARIELFRVPTYHAGPESLVFQQGDEDALTRLRLRRDGRVSFYPVSGATESSRTQQTTATDGVGSSTALDASTAATSRPDSTPSEDPEKQEPVQLQLTGRLGRDPWFNDQGEQATAGFPLAVNEEGGKTTWHRVLVFGEVADHVRTGLQKGQIKKGRMVQLGGTEVTRQEQTAKGGIRTTTEFHASSVTRLQSRPSR
jgi:Single-strand binding protein family